MYNIASKHRVLLQCMASTCRKFSEDSAIEIRSSFTVPRYPQAVSKNGLRAKWQRDKEWSWGFRIAEGCIIKGLLNHMTVELECDKCSSWSKATCTKSLVWGIRWKTHLSLCPWTTLSMLLSISYRVHWSRFQGHSSDIVRCTTVSPWWKVEDKEKKQVRQKISWLYTRLDFARSPFFRKGSEM